MHVNRQVAPPSVFLRICCKLEWSFYYVHSETYGVRIKIRATACPSVFTHDETGESQKGLL
jgi:hypothetical protein